MENMAKGLLTILIGVMLVYYGKQLIAQGRNLLSALTNMGIAGRFPK